MSETVGSVNTYICEDCEAHTVVEILHDGTTPLAMLCPECGKGTAQSQMYRYDPEDGPPTMGFYSPTSEQALAALTPGAADHVSNGGLLLCRLDVRANKEQP